MATQAHPGGKVSVNAARARRLLLAQAIDEADPQGRLIAASEKDQAERDALRAVGGRDAGHAPEPLRYLDERARRILDRVRQRDARTAMLEVAEPWQRWLTWLLPLIALVLGATLERIDNPRQVNMLSPPLLAFVAWNLCIYLLLVLKALWPKARGQGGAAGALRDWLARRAGGGRRVRAAVAARFHLHWWRIAGALEGWRIQQLLHASSAAWAVGVGLAIVMGGLVREYRVGWESTLLDLPQVHAVLHALFAPVVALLPIEGFTLEDVRRMHFRSGVDVGQAEARHWIALYLGLLLMVVVIPRALLAIHAALRKTWLGSALPLDLEERYYAEVLARVSPARVVLAWSALEPRTRELVLRMWREATAQPGDPGPAPGQLWLLLQTDREDELQATELSSPSPSGGGPGWGHPASDTASATWRTRLQSWWHPPPATPAEPARIRADVILLALSDPAQLQSALPWLQDLGRPVFLLDARGCAPALAQIADDAGLGYEIFPLKTACCWAWEPPLREALSRRLPPHKSAGAKRLLATWEARHDARLQQAVSAMSTPLLLAARESQEVHAGPLSLRRIVNAGEREASQQAREQSMSALLARVGEAQARSVAQLRHLYAREAVPTAHGAPQLDERFVLRQSVHTSQAGMAGAASGAAAGATLDLMTGGLTLGAAAALGALVGGGAALAAAAWKNRATPNGTALVQLSDDMLQALCELALLQYLAACMRAHEDAAGVPASWRSEVVAAVEARRDRLQPLWEKARQPGGDSEVAAQLVQHLTALAREVLARL